MNDQPPSIDGGRGEPHPQPMEQRVTALESDMREIKAGLKQLITDMADLKRLPGDVADLKRDVASVKLDVAEIKGRLSQTPTTVQLIGLVFGIFAASFAPLKLTGHQ
jgi:hypothetical protein